MTRTEERFRNLLADEGKLLDELIGAMGLGTPEFERLIARLKENDRRRVHVLRQLDVEFAGRADEACPV